MTGHIPAQKDPREIDAKLIAKYGIAVSESTRARRKRLGLANLQYLRFDRFFVILATRGRHHFFEEEAAAIRDIRKIPLRFAGYSISYRPGGRTRSGEIDPRRHAHVELKRKPYLALKAQFLELATRRSGAVLGMKFYSLPVEPYAPIRRQLLNILRTVNQTRRKAGLSQMPTEVLSLRRRVVRPFGTADLTVAVRPTSSGPQSPQIAE